MLYRKIEKLLMVVMVVFAVSCQTQDIKKDKPNSNKKLQNWYNNNLNERSVVLPSIEMDKGKVLCGKKQDVFLLVNFDIPEIEIDKTQKRPDLNLAMVIDRSGSMEIGNKLEYVKKASSFVVNNLSKADILGIVEYDDRINILWPSSLVTAPQMINKLIMELTARGSTNLTGGMMKGVDEVLKNNKKDKINRVMLLSDGLANQGITDPSSINQLVRDTRDKGITISTLGVGLDYNEDLLQSIAENGGGNYYYIESPTQIQSIFNQEMITLFQTVAKNVQLKLNCFDMVDSISVFGYESKIVNKNALIKIPNLYSSEKRSLLIRLRVFTKKEIKQSLGTLTLTFHDCKRKKDMAYKINLVIEGTKDTVSVFASQNKTVVAEAVLVEADELHEQYVKQYERGNKKEAKENIKKLTKKVEDRNKTLKDTRVAKKIEALQLESEEIENAEKNRALRKMYLKKTKQKIYYAKKGKRGKYMMQSGDKSFEVSKLQKKLKELKLYSGPINGKYTNEVREAIMKYQKDNLLEIDGIAGPKTLKKLGLY